MGVEQRGSTPTVIQGISWFAELDACEIESGPTADESVNARAARRVRIESFRLALPGRLAAAVRAPRSAGTVDFATDPLCASCSLPLSSRHAEFVDGS